MTSFWTTIFDWFIPSIRFPDDIRDIEALRVSNRIASSNTRALGFPPTSGADATGHHRDQKTSRPHRRDSDVEVNGRRSRLVSEDSAGRVQRLTEENERLKREVAQLKANLQATQRTAASVSADANTPTPPSQPNPPTTAYAPSSTSSINLQFDYSKLLQDHERLKERLEQVSSLQVFLDRNDSKDGAWLVQRVQDLNGRIQQLAATVADTYHATLNGDAAYREEAAYREPPSHFDAVKRIVGEQMLELLTKRDHTADPIFLQYALQAWAVGRAKTVLDKFCFGAPRELDQALSAAFEGISANEPLATAFRWRALSHRHLKAYLSKPTAVPPTPVSPGSPAVFDDPIDRQVQRLIDDDIMGLQIMLTVAGWPSSRTYLREKLRDQYKLKLKLIYTETLELARALREDYMSGSHEIEVVPPRPAHILASSRHTDGSGLRIDVGSSERSVSLFDESTMDNILFGHGDESDGVLCTVAMGIAVRHVVEEQEKEEEKGAGKAYHHRQSSSTRASALDTPAISRTNSAANEESGLDAGHRRSSSASHPTADNPQVISRTTSLMPDTKPKVNRQLLLKPKVLLESIVTFYDGQLSSPI